MITIKFQKKQCLAIFKAFLILVELLFSGQLKIEAANYTVTSINDSGPGSLRTIILQSNQTPGPHSINFGQSWFGSGSANLKTPLPVVSNSVTIIGWAKGDSNNYIELRGVELEFAPGTESVLTFLSISGTIKNNGILSLRNSTIRDGGIVSSVVLVMSDSSLVNSSSNGLFNSGDATLDRVIIADSKGAGVLNTGSIFMRDCTLSNNVNINGGGGLANLSGKAHLLRCNLNNNQGSSGGAVYNGGDVVVDQCYVLKNSANSGGGVFNISKLSISSSTFFDNRVTGIPGGSSDWGRPDGGRGGGVLGGEGGKATIKISSFNYTQPTAGKDGGMGGGGGGGGSSTYSPIKGASGGSGGFGGGGGGGGMVGGTGGPGGEWGGSGMSASDVTGPFGGGGGSGAFGGAVHLLSGTLAATNSTFYENKVTGGAGLSGGGGAGLGGGIFIFSNTEAKFVNCTIVGNRCDGGIGYQSGKGAGGGIFVALDGKCYVQDTIVASNSSETQSNDVFGIFNGIGGNFIGDDSGSKGWNIALDYVNAKPLNLASLADNGGPTPTCALLPGSLCILGGSDSENPFTDQRGVLRPLGRRDIGAYQKTALIQTEITWKKPNQIIYGTPLGIRELSATANVDGVFKYSPPLGTVLNAGSNQLINVVFQPSDLSLYLPSTNSVTIDVLKSSQTINFPPIPPQANGAEFYKLNASASSGLPVTYSLISGDALLAGSILSFGRSTGLVVIKANQFGNNNYLEALPVEQSVLVGDPIAPVVTTQPSSQSVKIGGSAIFQVIATTAPLSYQWQFKGVNIPGETNAALVVTGVQASSEGSYRVVISNPFASTISDAALLTIALPTGVPVITAQTPNATIPIGGTVVLSVEAVGNYPLSYQWYAGVKGDLSKPIGGNSSNFVTPSLTNDVMYWVSIKNDRGTADSESFIIKVIPDYTAKLSVRSLGGLPVVSINGKIGSNYLLQSSDNLVGSNWTTVSNFKIILNPHTFIDSSGEQVAVRFYRAVAP
jgi:hypothetical protein